MSVAVEARQATEAAAEMIADRAQALADKAREIEVPELVRTLPERVTSPTPSRLRAQGNRRALGAMLAGALVGLAVSLIVLRRRARREAFGGDWVDEADERPIDLTSPVGTERAATA